MKTREKKEITNLDIENYIRVNAHQFLNSVLMGQGSPLFFDLSSSEKTELFNNVLDLDIWTDLSNKAKLIESTVESNKIKVSTEISKSEGALETLPKESDIDLLISSWYESVENSIATETSNIEKIENEIQDIQKILDSMDVSDEKLSKIQENISKCESFRMNLISSKSEIMTNISYIEKEIKSLHEDLKFYEDHSLCPVCKQDISIDFIKSSLSTINRNIEEKNKHVSLKNKEITKILKNLESVDKEIILLKNTYQEVNKTRVEYQKIKSSLDLLNRDKLQKEDIIHVYKNSINPHLKHMEDLYTNKIKYETRIKELKSEYASMEQEQEMYSFWKEHFKKIRLFIIKSIISQLNLDINTAISSIGLKGWEVCVSTESYTKSGEVRQTFSVEIYSPDIKVKVPWETWSGGETQRLSLASTMGLAVLIQRLRGTTFNIEVWDEPTTFLSNEGIQQFLQLLQYRGRVLKKQIWLIDHKVDDFPFDCIVSVIKDNDGSHISIALTKEGE